MSLWYGVMGGIALGNPGSVSFLLFELHRRQEEVVQWVPIVPVDLVHEVDQGMLFDAVIAKDVSDVSVVLLQTCALSFL